MGWGKFARVTIVAASDAGVVSGFQVTADPIPALTVEGLLALAALTAVAGLWAFAMRKG
jgi:hypothetical protein